MMSSSARSVSGGRRWQEGGRTMPSPAKGPGPGHGFVVSKTSQPRYLLGEVGRNGGAAPNTILVAP